MICNLETLKRLARLYPKCTIKEYIEVYKRAIEKINNK